jgi:hypothetical protein
MSLTILVPQPDTPRRRLQASEAPGKPWTRVAGGWIADLVAARRFIALCPSCDPKFNPRKHHYVPWRHDTYVVAKCDACGTLDIRCKPWIYETMVDDIEHQRRRRGRWAS